MKGQKYSYSCIDEDELEVLINESAIKAFSVTEDPAYLIKELFEQMMKEAIDDESPLVSVTRTSKCGKYSLKSEMFHDKSSIGHSQVKFQFRVLVGGSEWEDKDETN